MAAFALASSSTSEAFGQCDPINCGYRKTGEKISATIEHDFGNLPGEYYVYRKTSSVGTPTLVLRLPKTQKSIETTMPGGTGKEYRWFYIPVELNTNGSVKFRWAASEEILILRK